jgi:hypothetical protein
MTMSIMILTIGLGLAVGQAPGNPATAGESLKPEPGWKALGRSLWFDPAGRRVILRARVVLREGVLEHLMCKKGTKEHEAILATDAVPFQIHAGLLAAGATVGNPVQFAPEFRPPSGSPIAMELRWRQDGKLLHSDARRWVRDEKTKADLAIDWVFAGSVFYDDRITRKRLYAADTEGDLITVANFASAILDLPMASSANDADRMFTANTPRIPPVGTEVFMVMSPRPEPRPTGTTKNAPPEPRKSVPPETKKVETQDAGSTARRDR